MPASVIKSCRRKADRPADTITTGSGGKRSVHAVGNDLSCPASSWKYTRSSLQLFRRVTSKNCFPQRGWYGCVTRKSRGLRSGWGVFDCIEQRQTGAVSQDDQRRLHPRQDAVVAGGCPSQRGRLCQTVQHRAAAQRHRLHHAGR